MKEKWKNLNPNVKFGIVVLAILLFIALLLLLFGPKKKEKTYSASDFYEVKKTVLNDYNMFNFVSNKVNIFFQVNDDKYTYDLLDKSFKERNDVSSSNALEKTGKKNKDLGLHIKRVYEININADIVSYFVEGYLYNKTIEDELYYDNNSIKIINKDYTMLFTVDYDNMTMSFYPDISSKLAIEVLNEKENHYIENNDSNKLTESVLLTDYQVCSLYYKDIIFKIVNVPDDAYSILNKDSVNRFKTKDEFKKYLKKYYSNYMYDLKDCKRGQSKNVYYIYDSLNNEFKVEVSSVLKYNFVIP